jgi:hypothetical protein
VLGAHPARGVLAATAADHGDVNVDGTPTETDAWPPGPTAAIHMWSSG